MNPAFYGRGVKTVLPECTLAVFPGVVRLASAAGHQLHAFGNNVPATVHGQQVDVVACDSIGKHLEPKAFFGFKKPVSPGFSVFFKFQQVFFFMASMGDVPQKTWYVDSLSARHDDNLRYNV